MKRECETCIKRKTKWCPNSSECYDASEMIHYQNRIILLEERDKYKSLYENEKDKNDTLKRIINRCVEEIYNLIDDCDSVIGNKESSIVSKNKLMLMQKEKIIKILDLLKEIK